MPAGVTDRRFLRFVSALTLLSNELLGTNIPTTDEPMKLAQETIKEILQPKYGKEIPVQGKINIIIYKIKRFKYLSGIKKEVLNEPVCKKILKSIISHIYRPETIFR